MTYYRLKAWQKVRDVGLIERVFEFFSRDAAIIARKDLKSQGYETSEIEKVKE